MEATIKLKQVRTKNLKVLSFIGFVISWIVCLTESEKPTLIAHKYVKYGSHFGQLVKFGAYRTCIESYFKHA